ncbi:MAG: amphi-Trp domain-containing protein [Phycisphaerae bacterium]|jgi:amphi-Trp domain-containing protein|nr:amphi-Trp domain-containing protein [Phycisphaerae bacterium]
MAKQRKRSDRDIEKAYPVRQFTAKLRRMAVCLEKGRPFRIQIAGVRVRIPPHATISVEHEREGRSEEVEMQFKWRNA